MGKLTFVVTRIYVYETLCPNRCEPSLEVIMKMGAQWGSGFGRGCQGGCESDD